MTVPTTDQDVPASTFRAWLLGIIFTIVTNGLKQLFTMHNPPNKCPHILPPPHPGEGPSRFYLVLILLMCKLPI